MAISTKKQTYVYKLKKEEVQSGFPEEYDLKDENPHKRHFLMSPDFSVAVSENKFQGEKYICLTHFSKVQNVEMRLMPKSLMNTKSVFKGRKFVFFTPDLKYVGIKTNAGYYSLFRIKNCKLICNLKFDYCDFALTLGHGGFMTALGIIDVRTRTCLPWSLEALLHFSRDDIHIF